ncbi:hypothetical protein [Streptomyces griseomycini]|uniref:Uncharacterized protein n=1 Tax=Streptomyces griseomycini TaxID=66895 RepID=A0A7W7VAC5_9ACTN|nr:hypothetical protein [Streptomyces griseomycini]MBB4902820.1 hypothetical protein [Streptomyces griseomycini]GGQ34575.1 hypothetical protein GCM10010266_67310 [Streptomyces griseomycini]GGR51505.1 hypothetical protein GCM10015536_66280 [Streptomyces griseomycini]
MGHGSSGGDGTDQAAVDGQVLAVDVGRVGRGGERHSRGGLLRASEAVGA